MRTHTTTINQRFVSLVILACIGSTPFVSGCSSLETQESNEAPAATAQPANPFDIVTEAREHQAMPLMDEPTSASNPSTKPYAARLLQRAIQSEGGTSLTPAHYGHVIAGPKSPAISSLNTIPLADAVQNNVLIDQDYAVKEVDNIKEAPKKWVILEKPFARPTSLEGAGGHGIEDGIYAVIPFEKTQHQSDNLTQLLGEMVQRAQLVSGAFYVVGYSKKGEKANPENELKRPLSVERAHFIAKAIEDAGIPKSRIKVSDGGISQLDSSDHPASRVSVSFRAFR